MQAPAPQGWERIEAHEGIASLLELLHPARTFEAVERIVLAQAEGTTGVELAAVGDELEVRSIGNAVARVENIATGQSALVQLSQLADAIRYQPAVRELSS